jgi:Protein of unknown function (DUF3750)
MNNKFENLVNKEKYQVFLFSSLCTFPLSFASHGWFVVNQKGVLSRWAVNHRGNVGEKSWGHLALNFLPAFSGLNIFLFTSRGHFTARLIGLLEGDENSLAKKIADFIENSPNIYPYCDTYHFVGPNSNTYIQWVLNNFSQFKIKLPWNSFGKNYKKTRKI